MDVMDQRPKAKLAYINDRELFLSIRKERKSLARGIFTMGNSGTTVIDSSSLEWVLFCKSFGNKVLEN